MSKKMYRTARGANVDMTTMLTKNETVPAVGNMRVNARGDEIAADGTVTKTRNQIMQEYHRLSTMVPEDGAIPESSDAGVNNAIEDDWQDWEPTPQSVKEPTNVGRMVEEQTAQQQEPSGDLAASVKQAQTVGTTAQQSSATEQKTTEGVRRI